jgi:chromosome segregation ATPase
MSAYNVSNENFLLSLYKTYQSISNTAQEDLQVKIEEKNKELASLQSQLQVLSEKEGVQELQYKISELEVKVHTYSQRCGHLEQVVEEVQSGVNVPQTLQVR